MIPATAKIVASSISEDTGIRLDTLQLRYPRIVHPDFMTHRVMSRNASSSRAIPFISLTIRDADMYVPQFRKNKPGMQPGDYLSEMEQAAAEAIWREMADFVRERCAVLADKRGLNVHKQWVNRPLEWFGFIDVVVSATEWANFMALRDHPDAQDEIEALAKAIGVARDAAIPKTLSHGHWHLPYVGEEDVDEVSRMFKGRAKYHPDGVDEVLEQARRALKLDVSPRDAILLAMSAARCCRVSYSRHDGARPSITDDMIRYLGLAGSSPIHASPLEHQGRPLTAYEDDHLSGNFVGWLQYRKTLPGECVL